MKDIIGLVVVAVLMLGSVGYLILANEQIVQDGERLVLKTRPVDPRDPFRGDYVTLNYEIGQIPLETIPNDIDGYEYGPVYVSLREVDGVHIPVGVYRKPHDVPFVRGYVDSGISVSPAMVRYDFQQLFVPEGEGLVLEEATRDGELLIELRVDQYGQARITGYYLDGNYHASTSNW